MAKVTSGDVARAAGVSQPTVSRVFSGKSDLVAEQTRQRVLAAARELGYQANPTGRMLRTGRTQTIALVVPDLANGFYGAMAKSVQAAAGQQGYNLLVVDSNGDRGNELEAAQRLLLHSDGVILALPRSSDEELVGLAGPVVSAGRPVPGIPSVAIDEAIGATEALAHLSELGHRSVVYLGGQPDAPTQQYRWGALRDGAARYDIDLTAVGHLPTDAAAGPDVIDAAVRATLASDATALIAFNDRTALAVLSELHRRGVRVPDQLSLLSWDNLELSRATSPELTTVRMPLAQAGRLAAELLIGGLNDEAPAEPEPLPTTLVVRRSTAPPRPEPLPATATSDDHRPDTLTKETA